MADDSDDSEADGAQDPRALFERTMRRALTALTLTGPVAPGPS